MTPTYRNDSTSKTYRVSNMSGEAVNVLPGESVETFQDLRGHSDLTLTAATPYPKDMLFGEEIAFTGIQTVTRNTLGMAKGGTIYNRAGSGAVSGEIAVYLDSSTNEPPVAYLSQGRAFEMTEDLARKAKSIVLVSNASTTVDFYVTK